MNKIKNDELVSCDYKLNERISDDINLFRVYHYLRDEHTKHDLVNIILTSIDEDKLKRIFVDHLDDIEYMLPYIRK